MFLESVLCIGTVSLFFSKIKSNVSGNVRAFGCHNGYFFILSNLHCRTLEERKSICKGAYSEIKDELKRWKKQTRQKLA